MTRRLTVLLASLEAIVAAAIGIAAALAPLTLAWALHFGFSPDWVVFWRVAVDAWLLGHGVDVRFTLDPELAAALALPAAGEPIPVTIALLGFALLTALLGARAGGRIAEAGHGILGALSGVATFALVGLGVAATALHDAARPSLVQAALLPALVFALGVGAGILRAWARGDRPAGVIASRAARLDERVSAVVAAALRAGVGSVAILVAAASVLVTLLFALRFTVLIGLYEGLHTEVVGGIVVTLGQAAVLPNLVIWAAAWLVGPGFTLGTGSLVSPVGTALGPLPAIPVLGAIPESDSPFGFAGVLVPVVAAFLAGVGVRRGLDSHLGRVSPLLAAAAAAGAGLVAGLTLGLLAAASAGSAGPGRLADVGPDPLVVGLVAAIEVAIGTGIGIAVGRRSDADPLRPRR